jgi:hypothetical protein
MLIKVVGITFEVVVDVEVGVVFDVVEVGEVVDWRLVKTLPLIELGEVGELDGRSVEVVAGLNLRATLGGVEFVTWSWQPTDVRVTSSTSRVALSHLAQLLTEVVKLT